MRPPPAARGVPRPDRSNGARAFDGLAASATRLHGFVPARRHEPWRQIGQGGKHEQPLPGVAVGNLQQASGLCRVGIGVHRADVRRSVDGEPRATEHQEVEIKLARAPAPAVASPECTLEFLQSGEEIRCAGFRIGSARDVEGDCRVPEFGLVGHTDGRGGVQT